MKNWSDYTVKPEKRDIKINYDEIPPNEGEYICRTILGAMRKAFENPKIQQDYEKWKAERAQKLAENASL